MAKKILRKVSDFFHWFLCGILIGLVILGKNNVFITIALVFYGIEIFSIIAKIIGIRIMDKKLYKSYQELFNFLKDTHKERYGLYFTNQNEDIEFLTEVIDKEVELLLTLGESLLKDTNLSKKQKEGIEEIMNKTKVLRDDVQPSM